MADLIAVQPFSLTVSTSTLTLTQLKAAANQRVKIKRIGVSFAGVSNTAAPILVQLLVQTTAGTASAGTPVPVDGDVAETIQTTTQITFTGEPTASSILREWYVHPQTGMVEEFSLSKPPVLKGGTYAGLRVVSPGAGVACAGFIEFEE